MRSRIGCPSSQNSAGGSKSRLWFLPHGRRRRRSTDMTTDFSFAKQPGRFQHDPTNILDCISLAIPGNLYLLDSTIINSSSPSSTQSLLRKNYMPRGNCFVRNPPRRRRHLPKFLQLQSNIHAGTKAMKAFRNKILRNVRGLWQSSCPFCARVGRRGQHGPPTQSYCAWKGITDHCAHPGRAWSRLWNSWDRCWRCCSRSCAGCSSSGCSCAAYSSLSKDSRAKECAAHNGGRNNGTHTCQSSFREV